MLGQNKPNILNQRESFQVKYLYTAISRRLSEKVHATIPKGIVGVLSSLFFKEIQEIGKRGHGYMSASAKGKQQK